MAAYLRLLLMLLAFEVDAQVGPPLWRTLPGSTPISHRLKLHKDPSGAAQLGQTVMMSVEAAAPIETCAWTDPRGRWRPAESLNATNCGVMLLLLRDEDFGIWKCRITMTGVAHFQEGFFSVYAGARVDDQIRLPTHLLPRHYDLYLTAFLDPGNFSTLGHVSLQCQVRQSGSNITLHILDLTIFESSVDVRQISDVNRTVSVQGFGYDPERNFLMVHLGEDLTVDSDVVISMDFQGQLTDSMHGFYRSSYRLEGTNTTEYLATTQFEATYTRQSFPCMDEPAMKARFRVSLGRTREHIALSNMPLEKQAVPMEDNDMYVWDVFQTSLPMSSYLLAFVVSKMTLQPPLASVTSSGVLFRVWSRNDLIHQTGYASRISAPILEFFEDKFNVSFPLPKLDLIAIPDFASGAMENWGLITFRETSLLYDENLPSVSTKERVALVVAHELAHQWFGNLVTMQWWSDLWLNEGFATYMEYQGANVALPEAQLLNTFTLNEVHTFFGSDALHSSHPVSAPVTHPDAIKEIFDYISYSKGASLIRMLTYIMGKDVFNAAINDYLQMYQFGNAVTNQLWNVMSSRSMNMSEPSIMDVMTTWTTQTGYPVVTAVRDYDRGLICFTQHRFMFQKQDMERDPARWWIPLSFSSVVSAPNELRIRAWMPPTAIDILLPLEVPAYQAVLVNLQQMAPFRVNYDVRNWRMLESVLKENHHFIHPIMRAQIINDAFQLAMAGLMDYELAFEVTDYLDQERDLVPLTAAFREWLKLDALLKHSPAYEMFRMHAISRIEPIYNYLGLNSGFQSANLSISGSGHITTKLMEKVASVMCHLDYHPCIMSARQLFSSWRQTDPGVYRHDFFQDFSQKSHLLKASFCPSIRHGHQEDWQFLFYRYHQSKNAAEKVTILKALACSNDPGILVKYLNEIVLTAPASGIRKQDVLSILIKMTGTKEGNPLIWDLLLCKFDQVRKLIGSGTQGLGALIKAFARTITDPCTLKQLQDLCAEHKVALTKALKDVNAALEVASINLQFINLHYAKVFSWLRENSFKASPKRMLFQSYDSSMSFEEVMTEIY